MRFDVVIVGGGSAGCALAGRLSEDPSISVCLLEAGPRPNDPRIRIPLGVVWLMGHDRFDWRYQSEPHAHLAGRQVGVPRGRTLGGSGAINSMVYIRGRASDYDAWEASGCTGWGWSSMLPCFLRQENNRDLGNDPLHGDSGPLHVGDLPSPHPMIKRFIDAAGQAGVPFNRDFNGAVQEGVGNYQTTMHRGQRCSPADAYLGEARHRPNLEILTDVLVDRLEFEDRRCVSVIGRRDGDTVAIGVNREVTLCAGAIGSPAILLRSGVGPADDLRQLDIAVVHDNPAVGGNLHDHPAVGMHYGGGKDGYAISIATAVENLVAPFRYLFARKGLLSSNTVEGGGFAKTLPTLTEPDVQFHLIPARVGHEGGMLTWGRGYYSDVCLLKPESRGRLRLRSRDPDAAPAIDLNLLSEPGDKEALLRGAKLLRRILASPPLKHADAHELVPGPSVDEDDLPAFIEERLGTAYHPVGTCRMGPDDDPRSVVDPNLRAVGIENLRVADASIMPEIIAGNTNAASMVIGERAADVMMSA